MDTVAVKDVADLARRAHKGEIVGIRDPRRPELSSGTGIPVQSTVTASGVTALHSVKNLLDEWLPRPERKQGVARVMTLDSLQDLINRHKTKHSVVFAGYGAGGASPWIEAIIDYHPKDGDQPTDWGRHRVRYDFPLTKSFEQWRGQDTKAMTQASFAEFIEDHIHELTAAPPADAKAWEGMFRTKLATPADMMQLARGLNIRVEQHVVENVTLQSGEGEITFSESHRDGSPGSKSKLQVPGGFMVLMPLVEDGEPVRLVARLRYRVTSGAVSWVFQFHRLDEAVRDFVQRCVLQVETETELPWFMGSSEFSRQAAD